MGKPRLTLPWSRLLLQALGLALVWAAGPGILRADGVFPLALPGLALWAHVTRRAPSGYERRAWITDWLAVALLVGAEMAWVVYVAPPMLPLVALGLSAPLLVAGCALRRIANPAHAWSLPLALALPLAWVGAEALQHLLPQPFGVSWLDLGHPWIVAPVLAGSARVWGVWGLSWCAAALAGLALDLFERRARLAPALALGLAPLGLGVLASLATRPAPTEPGPRLLLVQPGIPQEVKNEGTDGLLILRTSLQHTAEGLKAGREAGRSAPDLVCWGETMFPVFVLADGLIERFEQGLALPETAFPLTLEQYRETRLWERVIIDGSLYGKPLPPELQSLSSLELPQRTSFLCGAEVLFEEDGRVRRGNGVVLWNGADGLKQPFALKQRLVPGAETFYGLERYEVVRAGVRYFAPYLPDLRPGAHTQVLELAREGGRPVRFSASVCFDNAFVEPYAAATADEHAAGRGLDFHLVVTNEAWYRGGYELDQMLCFSRLAALASARALVRASNDGISVAFDAAGRELARLRSRGRDREVAGHLEVTVPVPVDPAGAGLTPYVRTRHGWPWLALIALAGAWVLARVRNRGPGRE